MRIYGRFFVLAAMVITLFLGAMAARTYTYADLVHRLTDMEHLAVLPPVGETTHLASSYDRASVYDAQTGMYHNWNANKDGSGFIRQEGENIVMAEMNGPGCIWRIWSAAPNAGHVKIYLDGATTPVLDLPFRSYFDRARGPFPWANLNYTAGDETATTRYVPGGNIYVPIPYQKSCKIVGEKNWGQYYQFNYTTFPADTVVPTFTGSFSDADKAALDAANTALGQCGTPPAYAGQKTISKSLLVPAVTSRAAVKVAALNLTGAQAITALKVKLALPKDAEAQRRLLRELTLQITWDDEKTPAVWAPLGDFFGYIGGAGAFQSLPVGLLDDGTFYSYWYMPFGKKASLVIDNEGSTPVSVQLEVVTAPLTQPLNTLGRFHAKWHRDAFLPDGDDRKIDWTLVRTQGRGRYVGTMQHIWCPISGWWGEGDEKFFVDGEKFPSTLGTGSEDYYGYAWGSPGRFIRPYHDQPLNEDNGGHIDNLRWHISDDIPFQTSFEGAIEKYFPDTPRSPYDNQSRFAAVAYWYLEANGTDPYPAVPVAQRIGYWVAPTPPYNEPGVIEAEALHMATMPKFSHWPEIQGLWRAGAEKWSGAKQLFWATDRGPNNETLALTLPVAKTGTYRVIVRCSNAPNYGIFQFALDGKPIGNPVDLYAPAFGPADPQELGTLNLTAGDHVLAISIVGRNAALNGRGGAFAMDYIKLVPVE